MVYSSRTSTVCACKYVFVTGWHMYVQIALFFLDQMIKMEPNAGPTERERERGRTEKITNTPPH